MSLSFSRYTNSVHNSTRTKSYLDDWSVVEELSRSHQVCGRAKPEAERLQVNVLVEPVELLLVVFLAHLVVYRPDQVDHLFRGRSQTRRLELTLRHVFQQL